MQKDNYYAISSGGIWDTYSLYSSRMQVHVDYLTDIV